MINISILYNHNMFFFLEKIKKMKLRPLLIYHKSKFLYFQQKNMLIYEENDHYWTLSQTYSIISEHCLLQCNSRIANHFSFQMTFSCDRRSSHVIDGCIWMEFRFLYGTAFLFIRFWKQVWNNMHFLCMYVW